MTIDIYWQLKSRLPAVKFLDIKGIPQNLRAMKAEEGIRKTRKATEIDEIGYKAATAAIADGVNDFEIINEPKLAVVCAGGDISHMNYEVSPKVGTIFRQPYDRKARKGNLICLDLGTAYRGSRSDLYRMLVIGESSERLIKLYQTLLMAEREGIKAIKLGIKFCDIYNIISEVFRDACYVN